MQVLLNDLADDSRPKIVQSLISWGYTPLVSDAGDVLNEFSSKPSLQMAILDWAQGQGLTLCRSIRKYFPKRNVYLLLLSYDRTEQEVQQAIDGGADDLILRPFRNSIVTFQIQRGLRTLTLENSISGYAQRIAQALEEVEHLRRLLPICLYCRKPRTDLDYKTAVEEYRQTYPSSKMDGSVCSSCYATGKTLSLDGKKRKEG